MFARLWKIQSKTIKKNETKPLPENLIQNEWENSPTETKYHETSPSETAPIVEKTVDVPQEKK